MRFADIGSGHSTARAPQSRVLYSIDRPRRCRDANALQWRPRSRFQTFQTERQKRAAFVFRKRMNLVHNNGFGFDPAVLPCALGKQRAEAFGVVNSRWGRWRCCLDRTGAAVSPVRTSIRIRWSSGSSAFSAFKAGSRLRWISLSRAFQRRNINSHNRILQTRRCALLGKPRQDGKKTRERLSAASRRQDQRIFARQRMRQCKLLNIAETWILRFEPARQHRRELRAVRSICRRASALPERRFVELFDPLEIIDILWPLVLSPSNNSWKA